MVFWIDGGSRGNPGPAGYGVRIVDRAGRVVDQLHGSIGIATNNVAEYGGLLAALRYASDHGCQDITIRSDSLLLVCQMKGEYRVKNPGLKVLHAEATRLARGLGRVRFEHVRREENTEADALANQAMDEGQKPAVAAGRDLRPGSATPKVIGRKAEPGTWPPTGRLF
jgi:ribonuclease HI